MRDRESRNDSPAPLSVHPQAGPLTGPVIPTTVLEPA